jgi:signal peptidase I
VLLKIIKIDGHSLEPVYQEGDYVFVSEIPLHFRGVRPGDVVVFDHPHDGKVIKLVNHLEDGGRSVFVIGLHPDSIDSRVYGAIPRNLIEGKVIWHVSRK